MNVFRWKSSCAIVLAAALSTAAFSGAKAAEKFRYALLTQPGVWDANVVAGIDNKFFAEEGLELELISPATPADGLKLVATGGAELGTGHSTDVIIARSRELPVVSIATNHQTGTSGVMVPADSGIKTLKDLEGKNVGITGIPFNKTMLEYSLKNAGADLSKVNVVAVGFTQIPLLLSKRIDALGDAITWSEIATYNLQIGKEAGDKTTYTYLPFAENGVPRFYTLGLVAEEGALKAKPDLYKKFLKAWQKSTEWVIANQEAAVDGLIKHYPAVNRSEALANLAEIARITESTETKANGIGWQDVDVWKKQEAFMKESGVLTADVDVTKALDTSFLPKP